jgi:hypothetical protein
MHTQLFHVGDQVRRGVVGQIAVRPRASGAALVEYDRAIVRGVEETAVHRAGAGARPAVKEHHRRPAWISRLFPVHFMPAVQSEMA